MLSETLSYFYDELMKNPSPIYIVFILSIWLIIKTADVIGVEDFVKKYMAKIDNRLQVRKRRGRENWSNLLNEKFDKQKKKDSNQSNISSRCNQNCWG